MEGAEQLERLLAAAAADAAERPAFVTALLDSNVLVLGAVAPAPIGQGASLGMTVHVKRLHDRHGLLVPFFTSLRTLEQTLLAVPGLDPGFLRMRCRYLFEVTRPARAVLNPHSAQGKAFQPSEIDAYLSGREPGMTTRTLAAEREVLVGSPPQIPSALPAVIARYLVQRPVVQAAHLGWMVQPDGQAGFLLIVVSESRDKALEGLGSVAVGELTGGHTLDVIVVPPRREHILSSIEPFYVRRPQVDVTARY